MRSRCLFSLARLLILLPVLLFSAAACSSETKNSTGTSPDPLILDLPQVYSSVTSLTVQVAYEPDAVPYTGTFQDGTPYWWILQNNIDAMFQGRGISLNVPWDIDGMDPMPGQDKESWTTTEIVDLARSIWSAPMTVSTAYIHVLFLNGNFEDNGTIKTQVLGLSFAGTSLIAIFKDVIIASGSTTTISRFVEQATLVHESGHVLGLVNNGVPMVSQHVDSDHPLHCTNPDCVMYWLNEGAADLRDFVRQVMETDSLVLFGGECLEDAWAYSP